jgi:hypothetical protein
MKLVANRLADFHVGLADEVSQVADVLIFSAAMGAAQWQTSRMTHPVRLRRNPMI